MKESCTLIIEYSWQKFSEKVSKSIDIWCTIYYNTIIGGEKQMSNRNRRKPKMKKSEIDIKSWLLGAITDLIIGIILLILDKLLN